jgi:S-adenosylhomocysteine hydrolase
LQRRDKTLVHELEWLREFTPATRGAASSLPPMGRERMLVVCHLNVKMISYFETLVVVGAKVWACAANPATTRDAVAEHLNDLGVRVPARFVDPSERHAARLDLTYPVFIWAGAPIKQGLHNRHLVCLMAMNTFLNVTRLSLYGKTVIVFRCGPVGVGPARHLGVVVEGCD